MIFEVKDAAPEKYDLYENYNKEGTPIHFRFATINTAKISEIKAFVESYGFLYEDLYKLDEHQKGHNIDRLYFESLNDFKKEVIKMRQVIDLYNAVQNEPSQKEILSKLSSLDKSVMSLISSIYIDMANKNSSKVLIMKIILSEINDKFKNVRHIVNISGSSFIKEWKSPDLISYMYAVFSDDILNNRILRKCKKTSCNNYFYIYGNDKRKLYCSTNYARAETQRNYRKNKKARDNQM